MGLFSQTPEEKERREQTKAVLDRNRQQANAVAEQKRQEAAFSASPAGQALAARQSGMTIFQIDVPLSHTRGRTEAMLGAFSRTSNTTSYANVIQAIDEQGWRLENVGYVYRVTGSVSRDKFMASGQQEAVHGEIVGIYLFRAIETNKGEPA